AVRATFVAAPVCLLVGRAPAHLSGPTAQTQLAFLSFTETPEQTKVCSCRRILSNRLSHSYDCRSNSTRHACVQPSPGNTDRYAHGLTAMTSMTPALSPA